MHKQTNKTKSASLKIYAQATFGCCPQTALSRQRQKRRRGWKAIKWFCSKNSSDVFLGADLLWPFIVDNSYTPSSFKRNI